MTLNIVIPDKGIDSSQEIDLSKGKAIGISVTVDDTIVTQQSDWFGYM
jgi:hypothetical protein